MTGETSRSATTDWLNRATGVSTRTALHDWLASQLDGGKATRGSLAIYWGAVAVVSGDYILLEDGSGHIGLENDTGAILRE